MNEPAAHQVPTETALAPQEQRAGMMLAHVLGLLFGIIGALIYWVIVKDNNETPFIQDQAREVLNFELNAFVVISIAAILTVVLIGFVLVPLIWVTAFILSIIGAIKAYGGERFRYPFIIRVVT